MAIMAGSSFNWGEGEKITGISQDRIIFNSWFYRLRSGSFPTTFFLAFFFLSKPDRFCTTPPFLTPQGFKISPDGKICMNRIKERFEQCNPDKL